MENKRRAIVLAGGNDQIGLINELRKRGIDEIILIDYYKDPPAKKYVDKHYVESTLNIEKVLEITRNELPEIIITACTDQALVTMTYVAEKMQLPSYLSYKTALNLTNKVYMKNIFKKNKIPTSGFIIQSKPDIDNNQIKLNYPIVVKPSDCNSSVGISKVIDKNGLENAVKEAYLFSRSNQVIIEEFVNGEEFSIDAFVSEGKASIISITKLKKIKQNIDRFTIVQSILENELTDKQLSELSYIIQQIADGFKLRNSPLLIQVLINDNDISVIEFSARMGGGSKHQFIKYVTGYDIMNAYLDLFFNDKNKYSVSKDIRHASMNFVYVQPGIFSGINNIENLKADKLITDYYQYKRFNTNIVKSISSSDRVLGFMVIGNTEVDHNSKISKIDDSMEILNENNDDIMIHGLYN